jgi:hypothetical protein
MLGGRDFAELSRAASRFLAISGREDLGNVIGFFEAFVPEPTDVEAGLVAVDEFVVFVSLYWSVKAGAYPARDRA